MSETNTTNEMTQVNQIDTPEEVEVEKEKLAGSRKLIASGIVLAIGVGIALYKGDIPEHLLQLLEVVFGGFVAGNVAGHAMGAAIEHASIKYSKPIDTDAPVVVAGTEAAASPMELTDITSSLTKQAQALDVIQQTLLMIIKKAGLDK